MEKERQGGIMGLQEFLKKAGIRLLTKKAQCITSAVLSWQTNYGVGDIWVNGNRVFTFGAFTKDTENFDKVIEEMEVVVTHLLKKGVILRKHIGIKELEDMDREIIERNRFNSLKPLG